MEQESLSHKTLKNSAYNFIGYALPILFAVFVTPLTVQKLGVVEFGIFVLVATINSFLGFVDLGLSTALTKFVAEYHAQKKFDDLSKLLQSGFSLSLIFGIVGFLVFSAIGKWFLPIFNINTSSLQNIFPVFVLAGAAFFLNSLCVTQLAIVTALQRYDLLTKINTLNLVLSNALIVTALIFGYQLKAIMAINVIMLLVIFLLYWMASRKLLPEVSMKIKWNKAEIIKAYTFGLQTFVSNLATSALIFLDRLIIPLYLGPAQLSYYSLPGNVALKISGVTSSLSAMLFPMASALSGVGEEEKLKNVYVRAFRNLNIVAVGVTTGVVLFSNKILYFWLGADFANNGTVILIILAVTYYFISLYIPLNSLLLGLGKIQFLIRMSVFMAVINLVALFVLIPRLGIVGAAWAYFLSVLPILYGFWWVEKKIFNLTQRFEYYIKLYSKLLFVTLITSVIAYFGIIPFTNTVYHLLVLGPLTVVLYFLVYFLLRFAEDEDIETFKIFLKKFIKNY